jgi:Ca-activated chloride channel family protein
MQIEFIHPLYLWLLVSIPFLIISHFLLLRYNQYRALKFANFQALKRVTGKHLITKNYITLILRTSTLLFLILAISTPTLYLVQDIPAYDYVLAIDTSASMSATDMPPSRLETAKTMANEFAKKTPSTSNVGIVTFSGVTFIEQEMTPSKIEVGRSIDKITLQQSGGTDIPGALITGTNLLANSKQGKAIIILTDGSNTQGTFLEDSIGRAIEYTQKHNVKIYAIGIGSEGGPIGYLPEYYNISATYNQDNMITITNATGGTYYAALNNPDFNLAYDDILKRDIIGPVPYELSFPLLVLALMLLFVEWGLINSRYKRFP